MADGKVFTGKTRQGAGLVVSTGILGDFVLPNGASIRAAPRRSATSPPWPPSTPPRRADRVRRAYRSAWRQYDAWCARLGLPALSGDPQLVGMYTQTV